MGYAKHGRKKPRRRPEAYASRCSEKPVATKSKFFVQGHGKKCSAPAKGVPQCPSARKSDGVNSKVTGRAEDQQDSGEHGETPERAFPKSFSECLAEWNSVLIEAALLHSGHNPSCQRHKKYRDDFGRQFSPHSEDGITEAHGVMQREQKSPGNKERDSHPDEQTFPIDATPSLR